MNAKGQDPMSFKVLVIAIILLIILVILSVLLIRRGATVTVERTDFHLDESKYSCTDGWWTQYTSRYGMEMDGLSYNFYNDPQEYYDNLARHFNARLKDCGSKFIEGTEYYGCSVCHNWTLKEELTVETGDFKVINDFDSEYDLIRRSYEMEGENLSNGLKCISYDVRGNCLIAEDDEGNIAIGLETNGIIILGGEEGVFDGEV